MSLGKNLAKFAIPLVLLSGCSTTMYEGIIGKEDVKFEKKAGVRGNYNFLQITKNGDRGLVGRDLIQYFDYNQDGKIDTITIERGFGDYFSFKIGEKTKNIFELGQKEYDKYIKIKIPEARGKEIKEIIKILTN